MKKTVYYLVVLFIATSILSSFKSTDQKKLDNPPTEFELLVQYIEENGNFINSELAPPLVMATEIKENVKNKKYLVLDIRSESWFDYGHIKNAKNVKGPELLNYFENDIDPANFDKITVVCYSGQSAAYYSSLLRLYGYSNVYSMKWGMSSWDEEFAANSWVKNSKNDFADKLETTVNEMPVKGEFPTLSTGKTDGKEILKERIKATFAKPYKEFIVKAEVAFETPGDYFIVNYVNEERYNFGHIQGAVRYNPTTTLSSQTELYTLPTNKKVLVSCDTGQSAAYVVAYLHVIGYEVGNLAYGANSYMNALLIEKGWNGFSTNEIKNFPIVE